MRQLDAMKLTRLTIWCALIPPLVTAFSSTYELTVEPTLVRSNVTATECHDISLIPKENQCQFSQDYCQEYKIGVINYFTYYHCHLTTRPIIVASYTIILAMLFTTLGLTASEFLCSNLDTLANFFNMSESLAGVTFLALGNGSPDVFSTLEALKIDSTGLAIGELIGAALFITCCVVGSMAIVHPFEVAKRSFVRDVFFLLTGLCLSAVILRDGKISIFDSFLMISFYILYVILVVIWDYKMKQKRKMILLDRKARNQFSGINSNLAAYEVEANNEVNDDHLLSEIQGERTGIEELDQELDAEFSEIFENWTKESNEQINLIRPSLLQALDFNNKMNEIYDNSNDAISLHTIHHQPLNFTSASSRAKMSTSPSYKDDENGVKGGEQEEDRRIQTAPAKIHYEDRLQEELTTTYDHDLMEVSSITGLYDRGGNLCISDEEEAHKIVKQKVKDFLRKRGIDKKSNFLIKLLFPTTSKFREKSLLNKIFTIICLPLVTTLRLTIPVVQTEDKKILISEIWDDREPKDNYVLLLLQCLVSPFITHFLIFYENDYNWQFFVIPLIVSLGLLYITRTIKTMFKNGSQYAARFFTIVLTFFGFLISILWISTIATELIAIIKFFALIFDLSDAILGFTVFAIGNSLGDFISNFTIAKMGFPMMALSACFGGPLLNILLGVGGSSLFVLITSGKDGIQFKISKTLIVSGITLLINLVFLILIVPLNNWRMNQQIGWCMIGLWSFATLICVVFEVSGLS